MHRWKRNPQTANKRGFGMIRNIFPKKITKHSLWGFAIYTAILGAFIVLDQNILHLIAW